MSTKVWLVVRLVTCADTYYGEYPIVKGVYNQKPVLENNGDVAVEVEPGKELCLYEVLEEAGVNINYGGM